MDLRIPGLQRSVVKNAQSTSVRQLIQIENQQNGHAFQSFNPLSRKSIQMIRDVGNIELCKLLETGPKTHLIVCSPYWNIGILCCTCGHFLHKERGANQQLINYTTNLFSVPEIFIKKRRPHGHRDGKKPGDKEHHTANKLKKKCKKKCFPRNP